MKPRLLDLFCGAGGAAMGYHRAGFEVIGVDLDPQPDYPFEFVQSDAVEYLESWAYPDVDAIHASPPCQAYSAGARMRTGIAKNHPRLIEPIRDLLISVGLPYVIENVPEAPLLEPIQLCGSSFGISLIEGVRRHRDFESNVPLMSVPCAHGVHSIVVGVYGDHPENSVIRKGHPAIRARNVEHAQHVMGIDWTSSWHSLKEAIPPAYTEFIGAQLLAHVTQEVAA